MKMFIKNAVFFSIGGIGYGLIEIMWRGYTHWCMLLAGGICFINFSQVAQKFQKRSLFFKAVICAFNITAVELVFGLIFNIGLKKNVWDYSKIPFNFMGQICPLYTFVWGVMGMLFIPFAENLNNKASLLLKQENIK